jgi:glycosyltransferase involved in cell wall biosynthesis
MSTANKLAIVIPAYKSTYLAKTLDSIANQSNKNFTLYIGDDASPENLLSIVRNYIDIIDIQYKRFEKNLGSRDLVAQWNRCIELIGDETWIWLFSDDDIMNPTCVEKFYNNIEIYPDEDIFHFNVKIIDRKGDIIKECASFPDKLSAADFFAKRIKLQIHSFVVEYIFKRHTFFNEGMFQPFDLAWGSDDATWIKISKRRGIKTIKETEILWRWSDINISSINRDANILIRKLNANIAYLHWIRDNNTQLSLSKYVSNQDITKWILLGFIKTPCFTYMVKLKLVLKLLKSLNQFDQLIFATSYLSYWHLREKYKLNIQALG